MLDILKEFAIGFLQLVLEALLPVLVVFVIQWVRKQIEVAMSRLDDNQRWIVNEAVHMAVMAAEQMELAGKIEDKKDFALDTAQNYLNTHGIDLDILTLSRLIEAAVYEEFNRNKETPLLTVSAP